MKSKTERKREEINRRKRNEKTHMTIPSSTFPSISVGIFPTHSISIAYTNVAMSCTDQMLEIRTGVDEVAFVSIIFRGKPRGA